MAVQCVTMSQGLWTGGGVYGAWAVWQLQRPLGQKEAGSFEPSPTRPGKTAQWAPCAIPLTPAAGNWATLI
jgi:hypothetical protein